MEISNKPHVSIFLNITTMEYNCCPSRAVISSIIAYMCGVGVIITIIIGYICGVGGINIIIEIIGCVGGDIVGKIVGDQ